jgi:hypothetical protein
VLAKEGELVREERDVEERNDGLGSREGEGAQARPLSAGQDDRGYALGAQGSASLISMTGMPSRIG